MGTSTAQNMLARSALLMLALLGLSGCVPYPYEQLIEPTFQPTCEGPQLTGPATATPGETISISLDPATCDLDEAYYGEIIIRAAEDEVSIVAVDSVTSFPLEVALPADLSPGEVLVMLARPCNDVGTADCHYPYFELALR